MKNLFKHNKITSKSNLRKEEDGAIMVIAACCLVVFLSIASFATDLGLVYYQKSKLQNAMDAAALAGASYLPDKDLAKEVALQYVAKNGYTADDVIIEFPENDVIRVKDSYTAKTTFATLFNVNSVSMEAQAAAKYVNKNMSLDFDYLMFSGSKYVPFDMGGNFNIDGSVFANGNLNLSPGKGSTVSGSVASAASCYVNIWSVTVGSSASYQPYQEMPDWDDMIMSIAPTMSLDVFNISYNHCASGTPYYYSGSKRFPSGTTNLGDTYVGGNMTTEWGNNIVVNGNLYVDGNLDISGNLTVNGNLYVNGYIKRNSTYSLNVMDDMYAVGNVDLSGPTTIGGNVYTLGYLKKNGGSFGLTVGKNVYTYTYINWSSGNKSVGGGIYVYGYGVNDNADAAALCGPLTVGSDIYCGNGNTNRKTQLNFSGQGGYNITGIVYSEGKILASQGGNGFYLDGCLIAEDDIQIGGSTHTYTNEGTLSIYSRHGDITLQSAAGGFSLYGIIYAPEGNVALNSGGFNINGSIIGNTLTCYPGGLNMGKNDRELPYAKSMKCAVLVE